MGLHTYDMVTRLDFGFIRCCSTFSYTYLLCSDCALFLCFYLYVLSYCVVLYSDCPLCFTAMFNCSCLSEYSCYLHVLYLNVLCVVLPFDLELATFVLLPWRCVLSGLSIVFNRPLAFIFLFLHFYVVICNCFSVETVDTIKSKFY